MCCRETARSLCLCLHDRKESFVTNPWSHGVVTNDSFLSCRQRHRDCVSLCESFVTDYNLYGVATVSRIDKVIGLFCRISSLLYGSCAKATYNFIDPTSQSHPIVCHKGLFSVMRQTLVTNDSSLSLESKSTKYGLFDRALLQKSSCDKRLFNQNSV